jgi:hypothetical protein
LGTTAPTISRWKKRFLETGISGLQVKRFQKTPHKLTEALRSRILELTHVVPGDGFRCWSTRRLADELGVSKAIVHKVWSDAGLRPQRLRRYISIGRPDFEKRACDIFALFLHSSEHAAFFCTREKSVLGARVSRERGSAGNGLGALAEALSLDAMSGRTLDGGNRRFPTFLGAALKMCPPGLEKHLVLDNLYVYPTGDIEKVLVNHPRLRLHSVSNYSSWLGEVTEWFSNIEGSRAEWDALHSDVARKVCDLMQVRATGAHAFEWKHARAVAAAAGHSAVK